MPKAKKKVVVKTHASPKTAILQEWQEVEKGEKPIQNGYSLHLLESDHTAFLSQAEEIWSRSKSRIITVPSGPTRIVIIDKKTHAKLLSEGSIRYLDPIPEKFE